MAILTKEDITGAVILGQVEPLVSIGRYDEKAINNEMSNKGNASIVDVALFDFAVFTNAAGVDTSGMTTQQIDFYNSAILWYIASQYKAFDIQQKSKESCTQDDYRTKALWCQNACEMLGKINIELRAQAGFCEDKPVDFTDVLKAELMDFNCKTFE
ncbi:MAG: hypothetical protein HRU40_08340 [Saprospiraceae bacterium]|nr:hypothetical protein [Saprospiraceae bacterium]